MKMSFKPLDNVSFADLGWTTIFNVIGLHPSFQKQCA